MLLASENLRSTVGTFHSRSEGGFFCGLLKKTSYSILRRRKCDSSRFSSSSMVMSLPVLSLGEIALAEEVTRGHEEDGTKVRGGPAKPAPGGKIQLGFGGCGHHARASLPLSEETGPTAEGISLLRRHLLDHGD